MRLTLKLFMTSIKLPKHKFDIFLSTRVIIAGHKVKIVSFGDIIQILINVRVLKTVLLLFCAISRKVGIVWGTIYPCFINNF